MPTATPDNAGSLILIDSSVAVAVALKGHPDHAASAARLRGKRVGLSGHAWFETYSVLTRMPGSLRRSPVEVLQLLAKNFPESVFLTDEAAGRLGPELARLGIAGGSVYDALVGATARHHGRALLTGDLRAKGTYDALGVAAEFVR
ncbi:MAG: type II toxin-antitoxin system VapC family toxin [Chloroflexota bacterium]|nr:type II toxin-antitoxin system VapC family toxin [Chloroflexota bacterium]